MAPDGVDFIDENEARGGFLALLEHVTDAAGADADEHFDEVGTGDREEGHIGLAGDGAGEEGLAGAGRADHEDALRDAAAEFLEFLRVFKEFDEFLDLVLGLLDAGDVLEGDLVLISGHHAGAALAEIQGALSGHADLLAEEEVEDEEEDADGQEPEEGRGEEIGLGADGRLDAGLADLVENVGVPVHGDGGPEPDVIAGRAGVLIIAAQVLEVLLVVHEHFEGMLLGDRELLVLQHLEEIGGADFLGRAVGPLEKEGAGDEHQGGGKQNDASPVEIRVAAIAGIPHARILGRPLV